MQKVPALKVRQRSLRQATTPRWQPVSPPQLSRRRAARSQSCVQTRSATQCLRPPRNPCSKPSVTSSRSSQIASAASSAAVRQRQHRTFSGVLAGHAAYLTAWTLGLAVLHPRAVVPLQTSRSPSRSRNPSRRPAKPRPSPRRAACTLMSLTSSTYPALAPSVRRVIPEPYPALITLFLPSAAPRRPLRRLCPIAQQEQEQSPYDGVGSVPWPRGPATRCSAGACRLARLTARSSDHGCNAGSFCWNGFRSISQGLVPGIQLELGRPSAAQEAARRPGGGLGHRRARTV